MIACAVVARAFTPEVFLVRQHSRIGDPDGRTSETGEVQVAERRNVGAPTFKVLLEVREWVTKTKRTAVTANSQIGTEPEVIA
jgi:hypothetical protein